MKVFIFKFISWFANRNLSNIFYHLNHLIELTKVYTYFIINYSSVKNILSTLTLKYKFLPCIYKTFVYTSRYLGVIIPNILLNKQLPFLISLGHLLIYCIYVYVYNIKKHFVFSSFKLISTNLFLWIHRISSSKRWNSTVVEEHINKTNYLSCIFRSDEINHFLVVRHA